jgi:hypothetical protein
MGNARLYSTIGSYLAPSQFELKLQIYQSRFLNARKKKLLLSSTTYVILYVN